jgi:hypothetical protein
VQRDIATQIVDNAISNFCSLKNKLPGIVTMIGGTCNFVNDKSINFIGDTISHCISINFKDKAAYEPF